MIDLHIAAKKRCTYCKIDYPATDEYFLKNKLMPDGLCGKCRNCKRKITKKQAREEYLISLWNGKEIVKPILNKKVGP